MNGLADGGPDLLLAALSESGLALDDFSAAGNVGDQPEFDFGLFGPPNPSQAPPMENFHLGLQNNEVDPLLEMLSQGNGQQQQQQPQPMSVSTPVTQQMTNFGHTITKHQTSSGTNSGTVYVVKKNSPWVPLNAPSTTISAAGVSARPNVYKTITHKPKSGASPTVVVTSVPQRGPNIQMTNRESILARIKTAPASLSALLSDNPSAGSVKPNGFAQRPQPQPTGNGVTALGPPAMKKELTPKDVSRLWSNEDLNLNEMVPQVKKQVEQEIDDEEEENMGHAETYANYMPSKLRIGLQHPDPVVETSSMASVQPPNVYYRISIPEEIIDRRQLSALQLESITYACQQHETMLLNGERAGYLIGDGAGVGKGRTIAGIIYENYLLGRKRAIWFSVSNDLKVDAVRDLTDISANIPVHSLNKFKYVKINSHSNGYVKKGIIFSRGER